MTALYTWQERSWEHLSAVRLRLPHAILLHGRPGLGKSYLARLLAQSLLCAKPVQAALPCGCCEPCRWFLLGNHPDFRLLQPDSMAPAVEEEGTARKEKKRSDQIRIDQVREIERFLAVGTHRGGHRIIVIDPAEAMNLATQNSLLKSLEEPAVGTLFVLVSSHPDRLLATVRSRCQRIPIVPPSPKEAIQWLSEQGVENADVALSAGAGAPLIAVESVQLEGVRSALINRISQQDFDPLELAQLCESLESRVAVSWLQCWVHDLLQMKSAGSLRYHPGQEEAIGEIARRVNAAPLFGYWRRLAQARALSQHPLNARSFLEGLFLDYQDSLKPT